MTAACDPKTAFQSQQICLRTPTVPESIEYAKKNRVLYGSPGRGNILHLATEVFGQKAGIKMEHVLYTGVSEVMTGLPSGGVQVMFVTPPSVMGLVKDGRVRALAFTGTKPFPPFPNDEGCAAGLSAR
jgi:tripartite-type tricarboxylate transporter receptor subunit TctC